MNRAVALTAGEPAGIGPEQALAAWARLRGHQPYYLLADRGMVADRGSPTPVIEIEHPGEAVAAFERGLPLMHRPFPAPVRPGKPDPANAGAILASIRTAAGHACSGLAAAICTGPVNKRILVVGGGFGHPGQTEFLADLCDTRRAVMMLVSPSLRVVPATTHIALADVPQSLDRETLIDVCETTLSSLSRDFAISQPRLELAGLNPHAGDSGLFGEEEREIIIPAISELRARGHAVLGPTSADTMFHSQARTRYDAAICMYHDQALIPFKTLDFFNGVNVTLGLPIVRTSPDHGPALDIAGTGTARSTSLEEAILLAGRLADARCHQ